MLWSSLCCVSGFLTFIHDHFDFNFIFPVWHPRIRLLLVATASIVDSEAQSDLRMDQIKLPTGLQTALKNAGVVTISALACAYGQPGQPIVPEKFQT